MGRGKHRKRNAIEQQDKDPKWRQQSVSVKGGLAASTVPHNGSQVNVTTNPSSSSRHHHGKKRKRSRKLSYPEQIRERQMLEIQASKYSSVGILRQLQSPDKNTGARREGRIVPTSSMRNIELSGDEYSDDSYNSESPRSLQVRPTLPSRQPAALETYPRNHDDRYPPGINASTKHSLHVGLSTVELPLPIDMPSMSSPINSRTSRGVLTNLRTHHKNAVNSPANQVGLTEIELPLSSSPIRSSAAKVRSTKRSPVRLPHFNDKRTSPPKSTCGLHSSSWSQQPEIEVFKELNMQSKQLGQTEIEIQLPGLDFDALNVDTTPARHMLHTTRKFADGNDQLNKTEIELPDFPEIEHMVDYLPEKKQKKTGNYNVIINEGIQMIRIPLSPRREHRNILDTAECSTRFAQAIPEICHGKQFVTMDDLPEFGSELNALVRPAVSHAHCSTKGIVPSTPSLPKPVNRKKSKPGLDIILDRVDNLTFYTRNTYFKSPVYDTWVCLSIADVQALKQKQIPATQMYGDHFWKNHPIKYICILGICVGVTIRETNAIVTVDDGSGREIECITKDQTRFAFVESIDPGSLVRVLGTVAYFRNAKQLDINTVSVIHDSYAEVEFWEKMLAIRNIIDKPWILKASDFSAEDRKRLRWSLSANDE
ncbi:telomere regulation protein Stn1-domain-containing protein [Lipomyces kononenkoae]|uniref:Telomere regulation protein Stn1-domain-containing protein n=1 Tax=Lipomyces kononenkoae TaxID=34357 RepID=A0ACC3T2X7_LIPKO